MANQITDQRTLLNSANAVTNWDNVGGSAAGTLDTDVKIEGTGCVGFNLSNAVQGLLYDAGSAQNWSNNHFYCWVKVDVAGLLEVKANGGLRLRFCGATVTNYFEIYVAGSDTYYGGWLMLVADIELARSTAVTNGWTGGTAPATSAIRYVGFVGDTGGVMTKKQDNFYVDAFWRLPDGTPGLRVEGRNGGTTDWNWNDIVSYSTSNGLGMCARLVNGTISLNAPIQFFINDASTHGFADTTETIGWETQEYAASDLYGLTVLGGSGAMSFSMGTKNGTGEAATGSLGCTILSDSANVRWYFDADDANIDAVGLYGCIFQHGGDFQLDQTNVEVISSIFIDCSSLTQSSSATAACLFQRNQVVSANTADGVAFVSAYSLDNIKFNTFQFSDGHAIQLTNSTGSPFTFTGNTFNGYAGTPGSNLTENSGSTDAALYNTSGAAVTISIDLTKGGNTPSVRNGAGATTTVNATVTLTITVLDPAGLPVENARVAIYDSNDVELMNELTSAAGVATEQYNYLADEDITIEVRAIDTTTPSYFPESLTGEITTNGFTLAVRLRVNSIIS